MTDGADNALMVRLLREIQATLAGHTETLAGHTATLAAHTETLTEHTAMFATVNARLDAHWAAIKETRADVAAIRAATPGAENPADAEAVRQALETLGEAFTRVAKRR